MISSIPRSMWACALAISLQSFLFGYCFSSLNSCLLTGDNSSGSDCYHGKDSSCPTGTIYNDLNLNTNEAQLATALTIAGAWIACMVGAKPTEIYGRKKSFLFNTVFFIIGAVLTATGNFVLLFIGRFISGIGVGMTSVVPPMLLAEIAPEEHRGIITTLHQLQITFSILLVAVIAYGFVTYVEHGWQYIQSFSAIPAILCLIFQDYIPESPKWLIQNELKNIDEKDEQVVIDTLLVSENGKEALKILNRLRQDTPEEEVKNELVSLIKEANHVKLNAHTNEVSWSEIIVDNRQAFIIGCGLMAFQALTGINSVVFYSTTIFSLAGFSESIIGTILYGIVNMGMTVVAAGFIDKMGRKVLLLNGSIVMFFALILLSAILLSDVDETVQGAIAVVAVLVYVVGFAIGLGAVVWSILAEIMPDRLRGKAMSIFLSINWCFNLIIALTTLSAIDGIGGVDSGMDDDDEIADREKSGVAGLYLIFAGFTFLCILFIYLLVPETKKSIKNQDEVNKDVLTPLMT